MNAEQKLEAIKSYIYTLKAVEQHDLLDDSLVVVISSGRGIMICDNIIEFINRIETMV